MEPGPAAFGPEARQGLSKVIRQIEFHRAKGFHDVDDGRIHGAVYLVPWDIVTQRPAPLLFGPVEEVSVDTIVSIFETPAVYRSDVGHKDSALLFLWDMIGVILVRAMPVSGLTGAVQL